MAGAMAIGGIFFRANDPEGLAAWYSAHLGVVTSGRPWQQQGGPLVFVPFRADSDYFPADRQWMVNFRVDDLPSLIQALRTSGIAVETRAEWNGDYGRFARIIDPEGNPIELWEAPAP